MARTPGSGWGAGPMLYQICPNCGKKKAIYVHSKYVGCKNFKCTACKERFDSNTLIRESHPK
jgi:ssDNA-binding Zn-finger/Zn-ribbon topoisomerase 1